MAVSAPAPAPASALMPVAIGRARDGGVRPEPPTMPVEPSTTPVRALNTLSRAFWAAVEARGEKLAFREKKLGLWRPVTWAQYGARARAAGLGLLGRGVRRGEVVAIAADNLAEWLYTDMGVLGIGATTNGVYTTDSPEQIAYLVNDSRAVAFIAENDEQLDKILAVRDRCPSLRLIVVIDMEGLRGLDDPGVIPFATLLGEGEALARAEPGLWAAELARGRPEDVGVLVYTSGTTGPPKGAMLTHANLVFQMEAASGMFDMREGDAQLSFLPLCHVAERCWSILFPIRTGAVVHFVESPETFREDLREVQPAFMLAVPRIWEKMYSATTIALAEALPLERAAYRWATRLRAAEAERRAAGGAPGVGLSLLARLADRLVLGNVKRALGLDRARYLLSGAAPISPDLLRWFQGLGLEISEVYGQTECSGVATAASGAAARVGTVGVAIPGTEVKLGPGGEVLIRGPHVFAGYMGQPERSAETIVDGWLRTGDVGVVEPDGHLRITDRMKDLIITAGGKNVSPSEIENQLKFSPFIADAVVIGDRRPYLVALVMIDHENVAKFAQDRAIPFTNFASLTRAEPVRALIGAEIEAVNKRLARVETVKRFALIERMLMAEDEELTPTMKLKRRVVEKNYRAEIEALYGGTPPGAGSGRREAASAGA